MITSKHPELDLTLYKYSRDTVYSRNWTEENLRARGLVKHGDIIVNNPMPKFFNYNEPEGLEVISKNKDIPRVYEKLDGSLIIAFKFNGQLIVTSSGSFISDHANIAREMIDSSKIKEGYTYSFELSHPDFRIVLPIEEPELILLSVRDYKGELDLDLFRDDFHCVGKLDLPIFTSIEEMERYCNWDHPLDKEGVILLYSSGDRVKLKTKTYLKAHKSRFNLSTKLTFSKWSEGEFIDDIPEEFVPDIQNEYSKYAYHYFLLESYIEECYIKYKDLDIKSFVKSIEKENKWLQVCLINRHKGISYRDYILKKIKPDFKIL